MSIQDFKKSWEGKQVKIISRCGEVVDTITTDVLWVDDSVHPFEVEYKGRKLPCMRLNLSNPTRVEYEAYV